MVEQGTHKPLVGSSNLPPGTLLKWLGFTFCAAQVVAITLARVLIWTPASRNISAVTQRQQSVSARNLRLWQKKKERRWKKRGESSER